jgi:hypothetical protein
MVPVEMSDATPAVLPEILALMRPPFRGGI